LDGPNQEQNAACREAVCIKLMVKDENEKRLTGKEPISLKIML
jgi:hypothetical protein